MPELMIDVKGVTKSFGDTAARQFAAVDQMLTGRENLELVGLLYHLKKAERKRHAQEVLERLALTDVADRLVKTYSGGMRRRLDVGASLVGRPKVLFLDEPTAGLDPASRIELWRFIDVFVADGATLLLTTQYLEEAERLADRIAVLDHGKMVAHGTVNELKDQLGGDVLEIAIADTGELDQAAALVAGRGPAVPSVDRARSRVSMPTEGGVKALIEAAHQLDQAGIGVADISPRRPSLDDVFLWLAGHSADPERAGHPGAGQSSGPDRPPAVGEAPARACRGGQL